MLVRSHRAHPWRNFWKQIQNGDINVYDKDAKITYNYTVEKGDITVFSEKIHYGANSEWPTGKTTITRYGKDQEVYVGGKLQSSVKFKPGSQMAKTSTFYDAQKEIKVAYTALDMFGTAIDVKMRSKLRSQYIHAIHITKKGSTRTMLKTKSSAPGFTFYGPDGRVYMEWKGKFSMAKLGNGLMGNYGMVTYKVNMFSDNAENFSRFVVDTASSYDCEVTTYNKDGSVNSHLIRKNRQFEGELRLCNKDVCYLGGVAIPIELHRAKPEEIDPHIILKEPNAQLRAALFKKVGFERVLQKCSAKVIDTQEEYALYEIELPEQKKINDGLTIWQRRVDHVIRLLKVKCPSTGAFYTLRVPPDINKVEDARQWTFRYDTRREEAIKLIEET